jgi:hypothetical protein
LQNAIWRRRFGILQGATVAGIWSLERWLRGKRGIWSRKGAGIGGGTAIAKERSMIMAIVPIFGAIGFSILYLLLGGGLGGAVLIFIIAKMLGK